MTFPTIEEIPFANVLIVDNKPKEVEGLKRDFKKRNISIIYAKKYAEAEAILKQRPELSLVVLDWRLDDQTSGEAKQLLHLIKKSCFAPIIIYTDQNADDPNQYLEKVGLNRIARAYNKDQVKCQQVFDEIKKWFIAKPELKIFLRWAYEVETRLNETLWTIHDLDADGIRSIISFLEPQDDASQLTQEEDLINFFGRILTRKLESNEKLLEVVKTDINAFPKREKKVKKEKKQTKEKTENKNNAQMDSGKIKTFHTFERYKPSKPKTLWTGCILKNASGEYSVVVTPKCDFSHKGKIENVLLLKAEPLEAYKKNRPTLTEDSIKSCLNQNTACVHFLPYAAGLTDGLVCRFDSIFGINEQQLRKDIEENKISCDSVIDSPFIENLIQRMNSYMMRLGTRDLDDGEIIKLLTSGIKKQ